ncbi:MAG: WecB/TagA/CpsF family glycosyltransferase [Bacteroidota bacterium]
MNKSVNVLGINIDLIDSSQLINEITNVPQKSFKIIGNANVKCMNLSVTSETYREFLHSCDIIFFDGVGVLLGARILGHKVKFEHRMTCPDFLDTMLMELVKKDLSIYFLASTPKVIDKLNKKLVEKHPNLRFKAHHGYFEKEGKENTDVTSDINQFQPDVLYIGFGMPLQEKWLSNNLNLLNCKVLLPLGACLDFYVGELYRGPKFLTDFGFEWLVRLFTEPRRLWRRYLIGNPLFVWRILMQKFHLTKYSNQQVDIFSAK